MSEGCAQNGGSYQTENFEFSVITFESTTDFCDYSQRRDRFIKGTFSNILDRKRLTHYNVKEYHVLYQKS